MDFIAIEVKSSVSPSKRDLKGLSVLNEEIPISRKRCVCLSGQPGLMDNGVEILPLEVFLNNLWHGAFIPPYDKVDLE